MAKAKTPSPKAKADAAPEAIAAPVAAAPDANYTVVARRYRPQQFADLIGQESVAQALTNSIQSGRIAHAYLFTGPRGTGKTSSARILAKALNCERGPTPTPCDRCEICLGIMAGDDVDVLEIDGASNNGVDKVRELRQNCIFRPNRSRFKIYIIDEVHMFSTAAFNALLKTLEEPPAHVKFIFATTEVQKIPITILSRCQRFDFHVVTPVKILATLQHIVQKEGLQAEDDALRLIAKRAAGSLRDSQTLLEQVVSFSEGKLTAARVHELFGTANDDRLVGLASSILNGDSRRSLELVGESIDQGLQAGELLDQIVDYWRNLMLLAIGGPQSLPLVASESMLQQMQAQVALCPLDRILAGLELLTGTKAKMRSTALSGVLVEMAVVRLARLGDLVSITDLSQWLKSGAIPAGVPTAALPQRSAVAPVAEPGKKKLTPEPVASVQPENPIIDSGNVTAIWTKLIQEAGPVAAAHLSSPGVFPAISGPNALAISVSADYTSTADYLRGERSLDALAAILKRCTGKEWTLRVNLLRGNDAAAIPAANPSSSQAGLALPRSPSTGTRKNDVLQLPFVRAAVDVLGAQLMMLDEGFNPLAVPVASPAPNPSVEADDENADTPPPIPLDPDED
jgi:DNA polymerase-3 subunit gamma/tau